MSGEAKNLKGKFRFKRKDFGKVGETSRFEKTIRLLEAKYPLFDAAMRSATNFGSPKKIGTDWLDRALLELQYLADAGWKVVGNGDDPDGSLGAFSSKERDRLLALLDEVERYRRELDALPRSDVDARYEALMDKDRPFSQPNTNADFGYWLAEKT